MTTMDEVAGPLAAIGGLVFDLDIYLADDDTHCAQHDGEVTDSLTRR